MHHKKHNGLLILTLFLILFIFSTGCGRKAPPELPEARGEIVYAYELRIKNEEVF